MSKRKAEKRVIWVNDYESQGVLGNQTYSSKKHADEERRRWKVAGRAVKFVEA